jgi:hypothetical protein
MHSSVAEKIQRAWRRDGPWWGQGQSATRRLAFNGLEGEKFMDLLILGRAWGECNVEFE